MPWWGDLLVGLAIAVGLLGSVLQILPGSTLVGTAVAVWGLVTGGTLGWTTAIIALVLTALAWVTGYLVAGRYLRKRQVPGRTMLVGAALGIVGFFVIPVVGLFLGFILGVYVMERIRLGAHEHAWRATVAAIKASGLTILVELTFALLITGTWVVALILR